MERSEDGKEYCYVLAEGPDTNVCGIVVSEATAQWWKSRDPDPSNTALSRWYQRFEVGVISQGFTQDRE